MALVIPSTALPDPPTWEEFTLGPNLLGGYFQITGNPAEVELLYGPYGMGDRLPAVALPTGSYSAARSPKGVPLTGLRARNATVGVGATLAGYFWTESDPTLSFIGVPSSQVVGSVVIPVIELADWPPASPTDGQTVWLELPAGATYNPEFSDPIRWLCTYDDTNNIWHVSGVELYDTIDTVEATASLVYTNLATTGPTLTFPVAGDYLVTLGWRNDATANDADGSMSYSIGGAAASDDDAAVHRSANAPERASVFAKRPETVAAAGTTIVAKYRSVSGISVEWSFRWISIKPVNIANA